MPNIQEKVSERIKKLRRAARLTQNQLAEKAGLSEDTIGALERGKASPSLDSLQKITGALQIRIKDFFDFEEEGEEIEEVKTAIADLTNYLKGRDSKDIHFIIRLIKLIYDWKDNKSLDN